MKIKETRQWQWLDVRKMCIQHDFYTCGNNQNFDWLYRFISTHKPTTTNIYKAAKDIVKHSDLRSYGQSEKENIESVMFALMNDCTCVFYEIEE